MVRELTAYLAGPIDSVSESDDWREEVKTQLLAMGIAVFDPYMAFRFPNKANIMENDLWIKQVNDTAISAAHMVVAADPHRSVGTAIECSLALEMCVPLCVIPRDDRASVPETPYLKGASIYTHEVGLSGIPRSVFISKFVSEHYGDSGIVTNLDRIWDSDH